ncbi:IS3 family transposase [Jeotgalibacillus marinus]|uniref:IS3 family transposase n=1 Tax=Jeotgalibacillus marinus TaxID=86667 RepID=A0ABV3Q6K1_9BACL
MFFLYGSEVDCFDQVVSKIDEYMEYYNKERIQEKLGYLTPKEFGALAP